MRASRDEHARAGTVTERRDAVVVGAGPNGLAAAITLAQAGRSVLVLEAAPTVGGGTRSAELTLPGFVHDVCSAVHPFLRVSPFLSRLPLQRHGLELTDPDVPLAHPLDGGRAAVVYPTVADTATALGADGPAYRRLLDPMVARWDQLTDHLLGPLVRVPRHPVALAGFGVRAVQPATWLGRRFRNDEAPALLAGAAGHGFLPLDRPLTGSFALMFLGAAHAAGWPVAVGGSQRIADAMAAHLGELGGEIRTDSPVTSVASLPPSRAVLLDVTPRQLAQLACDRLPAGYLRRLARFRYGPGVCKVDYALAGPVPWTNEACRRAGTVHVGGTMAEINDAEKRVWAGEHAERPFVLVSQPTIVDRSRAPTDRHTLWAYAHVPHGSTLDIGGAIDAQIERFAPGFRDLVLARHVRTAAEYENYDANCVGGDIAGGAHDGLQLLLRPVPSWHTYRTPDPALLLCSASTPPGAGVHGMCGHFAARAALRGVLR